MPTALHLPEPSLQIPFFFFLLHKRESYCVSKDLQQQQKTAKKPPLVFLSAEKEINVLTSEKDCCEIGTFGDTSFRHLLFLAVQLCGSLIAAAAESLGLS